MERLPPLPLTRKCPAPWDGEAKEAEVEENEGEDGVPAAFFSVGVSFY